MTMIRQVMPVQIRPVGDDEVELIISTGQLARDGHIFMPQGAQLENYRKNPIVLWQHLTEQPPVARAETVTIEGDSIAARVRFAPSGISPKADEIRGLVKSNIISAVSVGIDPIMTEPLDPKKPRGGQRVSAWELLEISFCNVPVDTGAGVTARAHSDDWKVCASRTLPLEDSDEWDAAAAETSVFEWAGGNDFDPSRARKAFLVYDSSRPKHRTSYKLPIARAIDGRLKVSKGAIRAAASRLSQAEVSASVKHSAQAVLDHYMEQAGMSKDTNGNGAGNDLVAKHTRALEEAPGTPKFKRGLYEVANFAAVLNQLGYMHDGCEYEAALEGDESPVPGMVGEALTKLGAALIAMTEEEVRELLEHVDGEEDADLPEEERAFIAAGATPRARAWRRGIAVIRAGRSLSASNEKRLTEADAHHERAMKHHRALAEHHEAVGGHMETAQAAHEKASNANGDAQAALTAAGEEPDKADEHIKRAMKACRACDGHLEDVGAAHADAHERHQDVTDSHAALGRSVKSAQRCVRAVVEGATPGGEDADDKDVQTSGGAGESTGSKGGRSIDPDFRRRQAELRELERAASRE
jgi:HK97 family phage prohead protease